MQYDGNREKELPTPREDTNDVCLQARVPIRALTKVVVTLSYAGIMASIGRNA